MPHMGQQLFGHPVVQVKTSSYYKMLQGANRLIRSKIVRTAAVCLPQCPSPHLRIRTGCHMRGAKEIAPGAKTVEAIMFLFLSAVGTDLALTLISPVPKTIDVTQHPDSIRS